MKKAKQAKKAAPRRAGRKVAPVPKGYGGVTAYLCVDGAAEAIAFYRKAFGAKEVMRMPGADGKVGHAEVEIGGARVMLADEYPDMGFLGPRQRGGSPVHLHLYTPGVDKVVARAVQAGAKLVREVQDQFYGDRLGTVEDPFGHVWHVATHVEDVPPKEMKKRAAKKAAGG